MSNARFFWKVMEDIRSFKAIVAWVQRGFRRKKPYQPKYMEKVNGRWRWKRHDSR